MEFLNFTSGGLPLRKMQMHTKGGIDKFTFGNVPVAVASQLLSEEKREDLESPAGYDCGYRTYLDYTCTTISSI